MLTTIYSFCPQPGCVDGNNPYSSPILGTDGNFYGSTGAGGSDLCDQSGCGTLFQLMPSGTLTTLHTFEMTDGSYPYTGVMQATNGAFYGTTYGGGTNTCGDGDIDCGTVFGLSVNLGPFITTTPPAGRIGAKVGILGTDLTGATGVTFNGIAAEFKIVSPTLIAAKVPSGAATGTVQVQLPSGKLTSSVPFIVLR